jgi:transcriptional regulator with XRE-family HTH domain
MKMEMSLLSIGKKVKEERLKRNLKQKDLAARIGISNTYLSDIEHDRVNPSLNTLKNISNALNLDFRDLV